MAWKETNVFEERMKFVVAWKRGGWSLTDLCREFNISRVTGYKYLKQYELFGLDGLKDKSRRPKRHPKTTRKKILELVLQERKDHPRWGARKLLASLRARFHMIKHWPHPSTVGRILKNHGLIKAPKRGSNANHYKKSKRKFPKRLVKAAYPTNISVGDVNDLGNLYFEGHRIFLSSALAEEQVGLEEISDRHVKIHFYGVSLGVIDLYTGKLLHFKNPMPS